MVQCSEWVDLSPRGPGGTSQVLAVHCQAAQLARSSTAVGEPAAYCPVQGITVDASQEPADRCLSGKATAGEHGVGAYAEPFPDLGRGVGVATR